MADYDSSLPIRTENDGDAVVRLVDETNAYYWLIDSASIGHVNLDDGTNQLVIGSNGELTVVFDPASQVKIWDGSDSLEVNSDGSINVVIQDQVAGAEVHVYNTTSAGVPGTPNIVISYPVTVGKTLQLKAVQACASGKFKAELKCGTPSSETTRAVWFGSTSTGTVELTFPQPIEVVAGDNVLVIVTNKDNANADVYAFINGNEI